MHEKTENERGKTMKEEKLKGVQSLDLELANMQWTTAAWQRWCIRNNVGIIIEDGRVTGWDHKEKRCHK